MQPKIIERKSENGKKEYGIRYADGHEKWFSSLPHARRAFTRAWLHRTEDDMATIRELFEQEPARVQRGIEYLSGFRYNHVPEIDSSLLDAGRWKDDFARLIEQVIFHEVRFDHRRSQVLFGVRYNSRWVMLCSNAGRELDDYHLTQLVDAEAYKDMVNYIRRELARIEVIETPPAFDLDTEVTFKFYGHDVRQPAPVYDL